MTARLRKTIFFITTVTAGTFILIFSLGGWFIRNHDKKKEFRDTFLQKNESLKSAAVTLLLDNDKIKKSIGLKALIRLRNPGWIDEKDCDALTSEGLDLEGVDLSGADLSGAHFDVDTRYNGVTKFPAGFDPEERGLKLIS